MESVGRGYCGLWVWKSALPPSSRTGFLKRVTVVIFFFAANLSMAMAVTFGGDFGAHDPRGSRASTSPTLGR